MNKPHYKKEDHKIYMREVWYPKNKAKHIALVQAGKDKLKLEVQKIKSQPCADCGVSYDPYVMDFDHVRGEKLNDIAVLVGRGNRNLVMEEIKKCDVVCANCHRLRTLKRRMSYTQHNKTIVL